MEYKIVNGENFEMNTIIFCGTMMEGVNTEDINYIISNNKIDRATLYEANSNISYSEAYKMGIKYINSLFDITYIGCNGYMLSEEGLNIIQLTIRLNELEKNNNIEEGYLNIFNCKDGRLLKACAII